MIVTKAVVGGEEILIETAEGTVRVVDGAAVTPTESGPATGPALKPTGVSERLHGAYDKAKAAIRAIAKDFSEQLQDSLVAGQKVELEFGLTLEGSGSVWVISGKTACTLKVKMTWEAKEGK